MTEYHNRNRGLIVGIAVATSAYMLEISLISLLLPEIQQALKLTRNELTLIVNAYGIAVAASVLAGGWFASKVGETRVFVAGIVIFLLGSLIASVSTNLAILLLGRLVQGAGGGLFYTVIPVLLASMSQGRPGRYLVIWNSFGGFIVAAVPLIAPPVMMYFGRRAIVIVLGVLALVALAALLTSHTSIPIRAQQERMDRRFQFSWPSKPVLFGYVALNYGTILLFIFMVPLHIAQHGLDPSATATILGVTWASFTFAGLLIRNWIDGPRVGLLLLASPIFVFSGFALLLSGSAGYLGILLAGFLVGCGFAFGNAPSTTLILRYAEDNYTALAASLDLTCARLGSVLIIALLGPVENSATVLAALAFMCLLNAWCARPFMAPAS